MTEIALVQYKLSRVFAQGWNAARKLPANAPADARVIGDLNPYKSEPERKRWHDGFIKGFA